jgi:aspartyl-tRNA(Asn)/glutamyl-tRNA(Gln) amidotransferase subunit B
VAAFFEHCASGLVADGALKLSPKKAGKRAANFIQSEVLRHAETEGLSARIPVTAEQVTELIALVESGTISGKMAKEVLAEMVATGSTARKIVDAKGLAQVTDETALREEVDRVVESNPKQVEQYRSGKKNVLGFFVGQVMKATGGAANPRLVNEILRKRLDG